VVVSLVQSLDLREGREHALVVQRRLKLAHLVGDEWKSLHANPDRNFIRKHCDRKHVDERTFRSASSDGTNRTKRYVVWL
jgi:hypothetical protein